MDIGRFVAPCLMVFLLSVLFVAIVPAKAIATKGTKTQYGKNDPVNR